MNLNILTIILSTALLIEYVVCDIIAYSRITADVMEEFRDLPAHFGPSPPSSGTKYLAIVGQPLQGCSDMAPPNRTSTAKSFGYVVLIARYNCSFEEKIRNAQNAGFDAVIVFNVGSNDLEQMSAKNSDGIVIPSVFVGERTGHLLMYSYATDEFGILINDDLPFNINTHLIIPFSIVVGLCFVTMIGFMVVKCVREQRRMRRYRLPSNLLKKIPVIKFAKGDNYDTCAICLDDYVEGDKLRVLPCAHAYHTKCIDPWLTKNRRVCPICKRKVFARGEQRRRRSSSDSMTDSEDDRTPLLNPVENSSNHGTFESSRQTNTTASAEGADAENNGSQPYQPPARFNPFDRFNASRIEPETEEPTRWERFKRLFTRRANVLDVHEDIEQPNSIQVVQSSSSINSPQSIPSSSAAMSAVAHTTSNNVLNKNLSGSFKGDEDDDDDDDDDVPNILTRPVEGRDGNTTPALAVSGNVVIPALPNTNFNPSPPSARRVI